MVKRIFIFIAIVFINILFIFGCTTKDSMVEKVEIEIKQDTPFETFNTFMSGQLFLDLDAMKAILTEPHRANIGDDASSFWKKEVYSYEISDGIIFGDTEEDNEVWAFTIADINLYDIDDTLIIYYLLKYVNLDEKWYIFNGDYSADDLLSMAKIKMNTNYIEMINKADMNNSRFIDKYPKYEKYFD